MKTAKLFRVKPGNSGQLPKGFPEGMLTALTEKDFELLQKNALLRECFEPINIVPHPAEVSSAPAKTE